MPHPDRRVRFNRLPLSVSVIASNQAAVSPPTYNQRMLANLVSNYHASYSDTKGDPPFAE
jgi:hypothetical protein